jgi:hypothetical protein
MVKPEVRKLWKEGIQGYPDNSGAKLNLSGTGLLEF